MYYDSKVTLLTVFDSRENWRSEDHNFFIFTLATCSLCLGCKESRGHVCVLRHGGQYFRPYFCAST